MNYPDNAVFEVVVFTLKADADEQLKPKRTDLVEALKTLPGFIDYRGLQPLGEDRRYVDLVVWRNQSDAEAAAAMVESGADQRFADFMSVVDGVVFMGHQRLQLVAA